MQKSLPLIRKLPSPVLSPANCSEHLYQHNAHVPTKPRVSLGSRCKLFPMRKTSGCKALPSRPTHKEQRGPPRLNFGQPPG